MKPVSIPSPSPVCALVPPLPLGEAWNGALSYPSVIEKILRLRCATLRMTQKPSPFPKGIPFERPFTGPQKGIKPAQPPWPIVEGHGGVFVQQAAPL